MANNTPTNTGGLSFFSILTLIFITLKLLGKIDWSWWLILAPSWILLLIVILLLLVAAYIETK